MVHTIRCHWLSGTTLASINNLESEPAHSGEWFRSPADQSILQE